MISYIIIHEFLYQYTGITHLCSYITVKPFLQFSLEKWKQALVDYSDELCSSLQPVINGLVNKLGTTLSKRTRSRVKTDRLLSDYEKVDEVVKSIKKREEFDKFCNTLEEFKYESLADTLKSAASD